MSWLLRPSVLVAALVLLAVGATAVALWPRGDAALYRATPLAVPEGDREVVWLYAATNAAAWERFVTAANRLREELPDLDLEVDASGAFPSESTGVAELTLRPRASTGRLRFRWYKLTSSLRTADWVNALMRDRTPPLAVIGGSSSGLATELAEALGNSGRADGPLLLLTRATADEVKTDHSLRPLTSLYPDRTFRFCFTNRQIALAVTQFVWSQPSLRPDGDPVYLAYWEDDSYSDDLAGRFLEALREPAACSVAHDFAWFASAGLGRLPPFDLTAPLNRLRLEQLPIPVRIPYSVGAYGRPNRWEAEAAVELSNRLIENPWQERPLLILPATSQPARRLLHGLVRNAPRRARSFVVVTGDGIGFNVVYRDRDLAWPIQDLPFPLVFFCNQDPASARAGFRPEESARPVAPDEGSPASGTEDLLLYGDILASLVRPSPGQPPLARDPDELAARLREETVGWAGVRRPLFDAAGNRHPGTGEHVVWLQPLMHDDRQLPLAELTVWAWDPDPANATGWRLSRHPLRVRYDEPLYKDFGN